MAKKQATTRPRPKRSSPAKGKRSAIHVIVDPQAKPSAYAKKALRLFSSGIQRAYKDLARKGVKTVVITDGIRIAAVPRRAGGRFVVAEGIRRKG